MLGSQQTCGLLLGGCELTIFLLIDLADQSNLTYLSLVNYGPGKCKSGQPLCPPIAPTKKQGLHLFLITLSRGNIIIRAPSTVLLSSPIYCRCQGHFCESRFVPASLQCIPLPMYGIDIELTHVGLCQSNFYF